MNTLRDFFLFVMFFVVVYLFYDVYIKGDEAAVAPVQFVQPVSQPPAVQPAVQPVQPAVVVQTVVVQPTNPPQAPLAPFVPYKTCEQATVYNSQNINDVSTSPLPYIPNGVPLVIASIEGSWARIDPAQFGKEYWIQTKSLCDK